MALGLLSRTYTTDVRLHHAPVGRLAGIVGVSGLRNSFEKFGEETLIPNNAYNNLGVYAFEQAELGRWNLSVGARYDYRRLTVEDDAELGVTAQRRTYNSVTGNLGALYRVAEPVALVFNLGRGYRAPTAFDLFSNGVHEGTVRFERGDSTLEERDLDQHRPRGAGPDQRAERRAGRVRQLHRQLHLPRSHRGGRPGVRLPDLRHHPGQRPAHRLRGRRWSTTPPRGSIFGAPRITPGGRTRPPIRRSRSSPRSGRPIRSSSRAGTRAASRIRTSRSAGSRTPGRPTSTPRTSLPRATRWCTSARESWCRWESAPWRWTSSSATRSTRSTPSFLSRYKTYALDPGRNFVVRLSAEF